MHASNGADVTVRWSPPNLSSRPPGDAMWFRNRLVNPVVRLLLRSPLHPVLSK
jgi:hypothetical protein